jgi:hypothetical protein
MAMGLGFLGRGRRQVAVRLTALHLFGAGTAGAIVGFCLGQLGSALGLREHSAWIIGISAVVATVLSLRRRKTKIGLQRQVPRRWEKPWDQIAVTRSGE